MQLSLGGWYRWRGRGDSPARFAGRLIAAVAATFLVVGVVGYVVVLDRLSDEQTAEYVAVQRADAHHFESVAARSGSRARALAQIDDLLNAIAQRPGTLEALLIDSHHALRASGEPGITGTVDSDARIDAALTQGRTYAGHEGDPTRDQSNFEFVVPVDLRGRRYAFEVSYSHASFDRRAHTLRAALILVELLAFFGGGAVFYVIGGRALMRDHRRALQRATRDGLTDLPNQRAFEDDIEQAVTAAHRYGDSLALAILDIDDFKLINDRHGHPHGDTVLRHVAEILRAGRPADRAYRTGGDEFAVLLSHTDAEGAGTLTRRLCQRFTESGVSCSIGFSVLRPGQPSDTLRAEADAAMYEAKRQGGKRSTSFSDLKDHVTVKSNQAKETVRRLIDEGNLSTVFQPIWDLAGHQLLGIEALTRPDPVYELSGPAEAFDIAEQIGRVHQLDTICVTSALNAIPQLATGVLLFINLSPHTLDLDADGNDWLLDAIHKAGLRPDQIVIEVTERYGGRTPAIIKTLTRLHHHGFKIALDDVGTGNSGLEMLRNIRVEFVKLDRSIVAAAPTEPGARAVLMAMATYAHQTGAYVIAEGIEDQDTLDYLHHLGHQQAPTDTIIQGGQGYGLGRPSPDLPPAATPDPIPSIR